MSQETEIRAKLTLTEIGVIISMLTSVGIGIFTLGVVYAQVQQNTREIGTIKPKVEGIEKRVERIDANVEFLTELAREDRARR